MRDMLFAVVITGIDRFRTTPAFFSRVGVGVGKERGEPRRRPTLKRWFGLVPDALSLSGLASGPFS